MTHRDFCYWLQGFFEIGEHNEDPHYDSEKLWIIKNHVNMCNEYMSRSHYERTKLSDFVMWMTGVVETVDLNELNLNYGFIFTKIKNKLNDIFEHVINKNSPGTVTVIRTSRDGIDRSLMGIENMAERERELRDKLQAQRERESESRRVPLSEISFKC